MLPGSERFVWKRRRLHFQPPAWQVEFLPGLDRLVGVVLAFTGHYVIAASADEGEARSHFDPEDIATPFSPVFLAWLGDRLDARVDHIDVTLARLGSCVGDDQLHAVAEPPDVRTTPSDRVPLK